MPRRKGPTVSSNADHNAWLRVSKENPCCGKCAPAREALLAFRALGYPRSKATAAAEKQLSRRVVNAIRKVPLQGVQVCAARAGGEAQYLRRQPGEGSQEGPVPHPEVAAHPGWHFRQAHVAGLATDPVHRRSQRLRRRDRASGEWGAGQ